MGAFAINGNTNIPQPNDMRHTKRPIVGYYSNGKPCYQGWETLECIYQVLDYTEMAVFEQLADPNNPACVIAYDDPFSGIQTTRNAILESPTIGGRSTLYYLQVVLKFTHLEKQITNTSETTTAGPVIVIATGPAISAGFAIDTSSDCVIVAPAPVFTFGAHPGASACTLTSTVPVVTTS